MAHWKEVLTQITPDADMRMAELRGRLYSQLGGVGPVKIITFRGYGSPKSIHLRGRVIEEHTHLTNEKDDRVWANLVDIYTHAQSRRVPYACLNARFQGMEKTITANGDGYFEVQFTPAQALAENRLWHPVEFQLVDPIPDAQSRYPVKSMGEVIVPAITARYGVISNIDNTLLPSDPADLLCTVRNAFLRTPHSRQVFPGEAALYRALYNGASGAEMNPLFYISTGAGNLYNLLIQSINLQSMPNGPILFTHKSKLSRLRQVLDLYPHLPFILFGDIEQEDAGTYTKLALEYPGRIPVIYLRYSQQQTWRADAIQALVERARQIGTRLVLASDSFSIANHAIEQGFIPVSVLPAILQDIRKDERPPDPVEALLCEPVRQPARVTKITRQAVKNDQSRSRSRPDRGRGPWTVEASQAQKSAAAFSAKKNK